MKTSFERSLEAFRENDFSNETIWRSIILFGKKSASYKFSLAKVIIEIYEIEHNYGLIQLPKPVFLYS